MDSNRFRLDSKKCKILYEKETGNILNVQRKPNGSASMPSFNAVCKSIYVYDDEEKNKLGTIVSEVAYSTKFAQNNFYILDEKLTKKPELKVSISPSGNIIFKVEGKRIDSINLKINNQELTLKLNNNKKELILDIDSGTTITIEVLDYKLRNNKIIIEDDKNVKYQD